MANQFNVIDFANACFSGVFLGEAKSILDSIDLNVCEELHPKAKELAMSWMVDSYFTEKILEIKEEMNIVIQSIYWIFKQREINEEVN